MKGLEALFEPTEEKLQPSSMLLYGYPKVGKTIIAAGLPGDTLILDFERGTDYIKSVNGKPFRHRKVVKDYKDVINVIRYLADNQIKLNFLVIDSLTEAMETVINQLAVKEANKSRNTPLPLDFDVTHLPYGAGQKYKKKVFNKLHDNFRQVADTVVYLGHVAEKYISEVDVGAPATGVDIEGRLANLVLAKTDVNGLIRRASDTTNVLDFDQTAAVAGTRFSRLKHEYVISEMEDDTKFVVNWHEVFPHLSKNPTIVEIY